MLQTWSNLISTDCTTTNLHILIRIQQSNCYSTLGIINFFQPQHYLEETNYLKTIIKSIPSNNYAIAITKPECLDIASFDAAQKILGQDIKIFNDIILQPNYYDDVILILTQDNYREISEILNKNFNINLYILRHEGDFKVNQTLEVSCDCNNCLANNLISMKNVFKFKQISKLTYYAGNSYSMLFYIADPIINLNPNSYNSNTNLNPNPYNYKPNYNSNTNINDNNSICKHSAKQMLPKMYINIYSKKIPKMDPYKHYRLLGEPKYIAAPMVGQSELAFRMMVRDLGAELCFTPMINAQMFLTNKEYQQELFSTTPLDRPLAAQLAGNDPEILLTAAIQLADHCDLIDLNLGCPQPIARRHKYGAWLMEDPAIIYKIVTTLTSNIKLPVSCKIRIFGSLEQTIQYAQMLEQAGCSLLTVHARPRKSNMNTEPANWQQIKAVKSYLSIPVIANGMIHSLQDANNCLTLTNCDGVMAASALLENPYLFTGKVVPPLTMIQNYLKYAEKYQAPLNYSITHVVQMAKRYLDVKTLNTIQQVESLMLLKNAVNRLNHQDFKFNNPNQYHNAIELVAATNDHCNFRQKT